MNQPTPATAQKRPRGRKATGNAKSSTERGQAADAAFKASGGRILNKMRLSPAAVAALMVLSAGTTDREAIEQALITQAQQKNKSVARNEK